MRGVTGSRHRFLVLDGLRGLAAIAVALYHAGLALGVPYLTTRAYLAVDFFFVLSGFVIAHAYEDQLTSGALSPVLVMLALAASRLYDSPVRRVMGRRLRAGSVRMAAAGPLDRARAEGRST